MFPDDLRTLKGGIGDGREVGFFELDRALEEKCSIPLGRSSKKRHKWGFFVLLFKRKELAKIAAGETMSWETVKWRPLVSTARNAFKKWYSFMGKFLSLCSKTRFKNGSMTESSAQVPRRVNRFNSAMKDKPEPLV